MSSNDEEDYMSDKFLSGISDVRPSLIQHRAKKRQVEINTKQKEHIKRQREIRAQHSGEIHNENFQKCLQRPLESANKGFQLLAKMGYKPGESLGKSSSGGIVEPIAINIKADRGGLGREAALRDIAEKRRRLHEKHLQRMRNETETITAEEYRRRVTQKAEERLTESALRKCQKSCEELDCTREHLETPYLKWFWPERLKKADDDEEQEIETQTNTETDEEDAFEYSSAEKLEMLTDYLRKSYNFCFWCGVHYDDEKDLQQNCPGLTKDDH